MGKTWVRSLAWVRPGEGKGYPLQYSGLEKSMGSQRVRYDWVTFSSFSSVVKYLSMSFSTIWLGCLDLFTIGFWNFIYMHIKPLLERCFANILFQSLTIFSPSIKKAFHRTRFLILMKSNLAIFTSMIMLLMTLLITPHKDVLLFFPESFIFWYFTFKSMVRFLINDCTWCEV